MKSKCCKAPIIFDIDHSKLCSKCLRLTFFTPQQEKIENILHSFITKFSKAITEIEAIEQIEKLIKDHCCTSEINVECAHNHQ